jgi:hypothetical protein
MEALAEESSRLYSVVRGDSRFESIRWPEVVPAANRGSAFGNVKWRAHFHPNRRCGDGMSLFAIAQDPHDNPLDVVEHMAVGNNWPFERAGEDEVAIVVTGRWTNYQVSFTWMGEIEALHLACAFDMRVPELRLAEVQQLIALINEQMWIGHFDVWTQNGVVMFRHALLLSGGGSASDRQCEAVLGTALDSCERYFPAFQFVVWAGKSAREAMDSVMFETSGEA